MYNFPLRNPLDPSPFSDDPIRSSRAPDDVRAVEPRPDAAAGDDDLQRLESSVQWIKREHDVIGIELELLARKRRRKLPPARQLAPVAGIPPVRTARVARVRATSTFRVAPPQAFERLQHPVSRQQRPRNLQGAACVLVVSVILGSSHVSRWVALGVGACAGGGASNAIAAGRAISICCGGADAARRPNSGPWCERSV
jgi:hypothetical protein